MANQTHYGGAIWTNHALERLSQRGLSQQLALEAFNRPDRTLAGKNPGTQEYQKRYQNSLVTLIVKQNERREWIVLSAWIDPPLAGSIDEVKKAEWERYKKAGFWGKFFLTIKRQIFGR